MWTIPHAWTDDNVAIKWHGYTSRYEILAAAKIPSETQESLYTSRPEKIILMPETSTFSVR